MIALAIVDEVGLEPDDRFDPVLLAGLVEVDGAVHHAVVGEPEGGLPELRGPRRHRVDLAGAVEQRVLAVGVEMDGGGVLTGGSDHAKRGRWLVGFRRLSALTPGDFRHP